MFPVFFEIGKGYPVESKTGGGDVPGALIAPVLIEDELKQSFLDYAMSVIVSRAIPDVRDGLKPVHRRVLYTMSQLGFHYNKPYHKSVRIVGDVMGKYHPHGDQAIYNTMVGMAQEFSKRYPLLDGHGNWGSVDGDSAAAMRYTEVRMAKISQEILADLDKETVDFVPNFDESTVEPVVLPSKLPNLLVNGTAGIAVGMATSIPPHNLTEIIDGCLALLKDPELSDAALFEKVPAPDFPTGGIICGRGGIVRAYTSGRGNLMLRGVVDVEESKKGSRCIITELPYQVNKADLIVKIVNLVKAKVIDGISHIRDESDKRGMRVVVDLKRGEIPQVVINQLYKHTDLQTTVSILMLGLLDKRPIIFSLRRLLTEFLDHRKEVVYKRTQYELSKAKARKHILAGFIIALENIDEFVALIKGSKTAADAIAEMNKRFLLSEEQAKSILDMKLQRITGMEQDKIREEVAEIKERILKLTQIIEDQEILRKEVSTELDEIKSQYGDERKTRIEGAVDVLSEADLVPDEEVVVTLTRKGYVKRVPLDTYGIQHRGGKGKMGMASLEEQDDIIQDIFVTKNHDELLFFTNFGRVYSLNVFEVPEASRIAKGRAVVNLLNLNPNEKVVKLLCMRGMEDKFIVMLTKKGVIKRTNAMVFSKIRSTGIRAINMHDDDELVCCSVSDGDDSIVIATSNGRGIRFSETEVRPMKRHAGGVTGIRVKDDDFVVGMEIISDDKGAILFATENGYGKRTKFEHFRVAHRGGVGVRTIPTPQRNGRVVGLAVVDDDSSILLVDTTGKIIRLAPKEIRTMGRHASGVRLIRLDKGQKLGAVAVFGESDDDTPEKPKEEQPTPAKETKAEKSEEKAVAVEEQVVEEVVEEEAVVEEKPKTAKPKTKTSTDEKPEEKKEEVKEEVPKKAAPKKPDKKKPEGGGGGQMKIG